MLSGRSFLREGTRRTQKPAYSFATVREPQAGAVKDTAAADSENFLKEKFRAVQAGY